MDPEIRSDVHKQVPAEPKLTLETLQDTAGLGFQTPYPARQKGPVPPRGTRPAVDRLRKKALK